MKILIAQSYYRILDPKEDNKNMPYPPLGSIIVATYLKKLGYDIHFYDCMIADNLDGLYNEIQGIEPDLLLFYDDEFNYLTKMSLLNMRDNTFEVIKYVHEKKISSVVYTSDAIDHPSIYLAAGADLIIIGEGETVIEDILSNIEIDNSRIKFSKDILGIAYLDQDSLIKTQKKPLRSNLNELPDPDFDLFTDILAYRDIWIQTHGYFSLNISTSRGCTYGCNWCSKPLWGRTYNSFSPQRIANLFKKLQNQYKVDHIWITDDIFGLQKNWLQEFSEICINENIQVPYKCLSRADLLIKGDTVKYLKSSGCQMIWIGAESGSQKILDAMDKGIKVDQIYEATELVKSNKMEIAFFLQLGYLGELWDDINKTRKLVKECLPMDIGISVSYPLPGTKFYNIVKDQLSEKQNWSDSDDLDMLFHGTFSRDFYKAVHKLIHNEYRYYNTKENLQILKIPKLIYHALMMIRYNFKVNQLKRKESKNSNSLVGLPITG